MFCSEFTPASSCFRDSQLGVRVHQTAPVSMRNTWYRVRVGGAFWEWWVAAPRSLQLPQGFVLMRLFCFIVHHSYTTMGDLRCKTVDNINANVCVYGDTYTDTKHKQLNNPSITDTTTETGIHASYIHTTRQYMHTDHRHQNKPPYHAVRHCNIHTGHA